MKNGVKGRPFEKGNKYGPGSRAQTRPDFLTQALISRLNEIEKRGPHKGKPRYQRLLNALLANAFAGDMLAIKEVFDRVQGRAHTMIELGTGNETIRIERVVRTIIEPGQRVPPSIEVIESVPLIEHRSNGRGE